MRLRNLLGAFAALSLAGSAQALTVNLTLDQMMVGDIVTFTVGIDDPLSDDAPTISGFDLTVAWDDNELDFDGFSLLYPGGSPATVPASPGGSRVASLNFASPATTDLFSISFELVNPISDNAFDDFFVFGLSNAGTECPAVLDCTGFVPNGNVISPPLGSTDTREVLNRSGFAVELPTVSVPEPSLLALLAFAAVPFALRRR